MVKAMRTLRVNDQDAIADGRHVDAYMEAQSALVDIAQGKNAADAKRQNESRSATGLADERKHRSVSGRFAASNVRPSSPTPYYDEDGITLYCGDARDIVPLLSDFVLVTDPPHGVAMGVDKDMRGGKHGLGKGAYHGYGDTYEEWCESVLPAIHESVKRSKRAAVFTGPHLQEQPKASAIGGIYCPAGAGRHSWGFKTLLPVLFYGTAPNLNLGAKPNTLQSSATADKNGHPCPKPLEWMLWLVNLASEPTDTILDPFAGSGTTLRAAKDLGRRAIGIEVNEAYCRIAVSQLAQGVLWRPNDSSSATGRK